MTTLIGNRPMSTKVEKDAILQAAATASHGTMYTVTDYSGVGWLSFIGSRQGADGNDAYFELTLDGGTTETIDCGSLANEDLIYYAGTASVCIPLYAEFTSALLFKVGNDNVGAQTIVGVCIYAHASEEIGREIIAAGEVLPGRDYTYPFDVMVIYFASGSNKIEFLSSDKVEIAVLPDGTIQGELRKHEYNLTLGQPRTNWTKKIESKETVIELRDLEGYPGIHKFKVPVIDGVLDNSNLPKKEVLPIIDATKIV